MEKALNFARLLTSWALFVVLIGAILALGANRPVSWTFLSLAVLGLFGLTLLLDMLQPRPRALHRLWLPGLLFLAVLIWAGLQILPMPWPDGWTHPVWTLAPDAPALISADPVRGPHMIMRLATYAMVFWMALRMAGTRATAMTFLRAFAIFSTVLAGFGIYANATGANPILGELTRPVVSASFVNRNNYATFACFGLVTNLALLLAAARDWEARRKSLFAGFLEGILRGGWIWIAGITACGGAIFLTQSRGGAIAALIGVFVLLSTQFLRGSRAAIGPTLAVGGITAAVVASASTGVINRAMATSDEEGRFAVFPKIAEGILDRPWLGHGLGGFEDAFRAYVPVEAGFGEWDMAHNSYLENAFELGLPAAGLFYLVLALIGWRLYQGVRTRHRARPVVACALACYILAAFHAAFDFSLQMPALAAFFAWLMGIGYAQSFSEQDMATGTSRRDL